MDPAKKSVNLSVGLTLENLIDGALTLEQGEFDKLRGLLKKGLENLIKAQKINNRAAKEFKQLITERKIKMEKINITEFFGSSTLTHRVEVGKIEVEEISVKEVVKDEEWLLTMKILVNDFYSLEHVAVFYEKGQTDEVIESIREAKEIFLNKLTRTAKIPNAADGKTKWTNCSREIELEETCQIFMSLEIYRGNLYIRVDAENGILSGFESGFLPALLRKHCHQTKEQCSLRTEFSENDYCCQRPTNCVPNCDGCFSKNLGIEDEKSIPFGKSSILDNFLEENFPETVKKLKKERARKEKFYGGGESGIPELSIATAKVAGADLQSSREMADFVSANWGKVVRKEGGDSNFLDYGEKVIWIRYPQEDGYSVCIVLEKSNMDNQIKEFFSSQDNFEKFVFYTKDKF